MRDFKNNSIMTKPVSSCCNINFSRSRLERNRGVKVEPDTFIRRISFAASGILSLL